MLATWLIAKGCLAEARGPTANLTKMVRKWLQKLRKAQLGVGKAVSAGILLRKHDGYRQIVPIYLKGCVEQYALKARWLY